MQRLQFTTPTGKKQKALYADVSKVVRNPETDLTEITVQGTVHEAIENPAELYKLNKIGANT